VLCRGEDSSVADAYRSAARTEEHRFPCGSDAEEYVSHRQAQRLAFEEYARKDPAVGAGVAYWLRM